MRIFDVISEASIFSRPDLYSFGHIVRFGGNKDVPQLLDQIQQQLPDFDKEEKLQWIAPLAKKPSGVQAITVFLPGRNRDATFFKRDNGDIIVVQGNRGKLENLLNHADKYNRGDIAEGILGAAITAKLIKRGGDKIGMIIADDIKKIIERATVRGKDSLEYTVKDKNSQIADKIIFELRLPERSLLALRNEKLWPQFENLFAAAEHYVNSSDAERYSNLFYQNGKVDEVNVKSDGVSDQKGRKTDIDVTVKRPDGKIQTLRNVDLSLKADSPVYGQIGSGGLQAGEDMWFAKASEIFSPLGITLTKPPKKKGGWKIIEYYTQLYKEGATKLEKMLAHASVNKESQVVEAVCDLIEKHGSLGNKNLRLVNFGKGGESTIHSFSIVKKNLLEKNIDLAAHFDISRDAHLPQIFIYDRNQAFKGDGLLTRIRFFNSQSKASSYFEKGPLLHELTLVVKNKPPVATVQPAPPQPAPLPAKSIAQPTAPVATPPSSLSNMTSITPTTSSVSQDTDPNEVDPAELNRIKKNAGITV